MMTKRLVHREGSLIAKPVQLKISRNLTHKMLRRATAKLFHSAPRQSIAQRAASRMVIKSLCFPCFMSLSTFLDVRWCLEEERFSCWGRGACSSLHWFLLHVSCQYFNRSHCQMLLFIGIWPYSFREERKLLAGLLTKMKKMEDPVRCSPYYASFTSFCSLYSKALSKRVPLLQSVINIK